MAKKDDNTVTLDIKTKNYTAADAADLIKDNSQLASFFAKNPKAVIETRFAANNPISVTEAFSGLATSLKGSERSARKKLKGAEGSTQLNEVFTAVVTRDKNGRIAARPYAGGTGTTSLAFYSPALHNAGGSSKGTPSVTDGTTPLSPPGGVKDTAKAHSLKNGSPLPPLRRNGKEYIVDLFWMLDPKTKRIVGHIAKGQYSYWSAEDNTFVGHTHHSNISYKGHNLGSPPSTADIKGTLTADSKFGYNRDRQYGIYDSVPDHLSMYPESIENQKRIARDIAARNRSAAGGEQLGLFSSGIPTVGGSIRERFPNAYAGHRKFRIGSGASVETDISGMRSSSSWIRSINDDSQVRLKNRRDKTKSDSRSGALTLDGWDNGPITPFDPYANQKISTYNASETKDKNRRLSTRSTSSRYEVPHWMSNFLDLFTKKPVEGSSLDILEKASRPRVGGPGGPGGPGASPSGNRSTKEPIGQRGFLGHFGEQARHAAIWNMYAPVMGGLAGIMSAPFMPYSTRAAGELVGLGATREEQTSSMSIHSSTSGIDPFRRTDESIRTSKKLLSAVGWSPSVTNQIKAKHLGETIHYVSKAADIDSEQLTQMAVRTAKMFGSTKYGEEEHINRILGGLYKSGALSSVKGPELTQAMSHGGAAFSALFGDSGKALAFSVPFIEAGVPNIGRVAQHMMSSETITKMAKAQLLSELNYSNMEKYGDNTKYAFGEKFLERLLQSKKGVPVNPQIHQRLQALRQSIFKDFQDPIANMQRHSRYGSQLIWGEKYGISIPKTDQIHSRFSMAAYELLQPGRADQTIGMYEATKSGFDTNAASTDVAQARGVKNAASDASAIWEDIKNYYGGGNNPLFLDDITSFVRGMTSYRTLASQVQSAVQKEKEPEAIRARLHDSALEIKKYMDQGHISDWHFRGFKPEGKTPEDYVNAMMRHYNSDKKFYENYKLTGEITKPYDGKVILPGGESWNGGDRESYNWDFTSEAKPATLFRKYPVQPISRVPLKPVDHTANVDPYELEYLNIGPKVGGEGESSSPVVSAIKELGTIFKQYFTAQPATNVQVSVNPNTPSKAEVTSSNASADPSSSVEGHVWF